MLKEILLVIIIVLVIFEVVFSIKFIIQNTKDLTELEFQEITQNLNTLTFSSISNLPLIEVDQEKPPQVVGCFSTPVPASLESDCKSICGADGRLIYVPEQGGFTSTGVPLNEGYYCVSTPHDDLNDCSRLYGVFVASANGYICENLYKTGIAGTMANLPLYKFVNGRYIPGIVLKRRSDDQVVDPLETFIDFNNKETLNEYYVDASEADIDGYNIACKNYVCFQDPCSNIPFTNFRYNVATGQCDCTGGTWSDPSDHSSMCIGTGIAEDSYDSSKQIMTLSTYCATSTTVAVPFPNIYPCANQALPLEQGNFKLYLILDVNATESDANSVPPNIWNKNVPGPTLLFEQDQE
jgi:hypothetical protein